MGKRGAFIEWLIANGHLPEGYDEKRPLIDYIGEARFVDMLYARFEDESEGEDDI